MPHMDVPVDYHVWGAMLEHYRIHAKAGQHHAELKIVLSTVWNYLLREFVDKAIVLFSQQISIVCPATGGK